MARIKLLRKITAKGNKPPEMVIFGTGIEILVKYPEDRFHVFFVGLWKCRLKIPHRGKRVCRAGDKVERE